MKVGDNIVVRISNVEKEDISDGDYFVANIEQRKRTLKLETTGIHSAVPRKKMTELLQFVGILLLIQGKIILELAFT